MGLPEFERELELLRRSLELKISKMTSPAAQELLDGGYTTKQVVIKGITPDMGASIYHQVEVFRGNETNRTVFVLNSSLTFFDQMSGGGEDFSATKEELDPQLLEAHLQETSRYLRLPLDKGKIQPIVIL